MTSSHSFTSGQVLSLGSAQPGVSRREDFFFFFFLGAIGALRGWALETYIYRANLSNYGGYVTKTSTLFSAQSRFCSYTLQRCFGNPEYCGFFCCFCCFFLLSPLQLCYCALCFSQPQSQAVAPPGQPNPKQPQQITNTLVFLDSLPESAQPAGFCHLTYFLPLALSRVIFPQLSALRPMQILSRFCNPMPRCEKISITSTLRKLSLL